MNYYALLSVSNKNGIVDFAEGLVRSGYQIISSGGTHAVLQAAGIPVMKVSEGKPRRPPPEFIARYGPVVLDLPDT